MSNDRSSEAVSEFSGGGGRGSGEEFSRGITKIAVAQICESSGFQSCQRSAIETLTDVTIRYLCDLGKSASHYANLAGRTECNVFDIVQGLEDLCCNQGFVGASNVNRCVGISGVVKEIVDFVGEVEEIPFAQAVPRFPIVRNWRPTPSFFQVGESVPVGAKHILPWMPAFPDPHTYVHTEMWNERSLDPRGDKIELLRQRRKGESSLLRLEQGLTANGPAGPSTSAGLGPGPSVSAVPPPVLNAEPPVTLDENIEKINPFLVPPLQHGEKDVQPITVPSKLISVEASPKSDTRGVSMSLLETFAPAIEAAKDGPDDDTGRDERERNGPGFPNRRPVVNFKVGFGKKSMVKPVMDTTPSRRSGGKLGYWFGREDEKDDKKRRAEQIMKESIENPHELAQL